MKSIFIIIFSILHFSLQGFCDSSICPRLFISFSQVLVDTSIVENILSRSLEELIFPTSHLNIDTELQTVFLVGEKQEGLYGGELHLIKRGDGMPWGSRYTYNKYDGQGNPVSPIQLLGEKAAAKAGFKVDDDNKVATIPDAYELTGLIQKLNEKLIRAGDQKILVHFYRQENPVKAPIDTYLRRYLGHFTNHNSPYDRMREKAQESEVTWLPSEDGAETHIHDVLHMNSIVDLQVLKLRSRKFTETILEFTDSLKSHFKGTPLENSSKKFSHALKHLRVFSIDEGTANYYYDLGYYERGLGQLEILNSAILPSLIESGYLPKSKFYIDEYSPHFDNKYVDHLREYVKKSTILSDLDHYIYTIKNPESYFESNEVIGREFYDNFINSAEFLNFYSSWKIHFAQQNPLLLQPINSTLEKLVEQYFQRRLLIIQMLEEL